MKKHLVFFILLTARFTFAGSETCQQYEAQFSGVVANHVTEMDYNGDPICHFQIGFDPNNYKWNQDCPLEITEAQTAILLDPSCSLHKGSSISGIIVKRGHRFTLE